MAETTQINHQLNDEDPDLEQKWHIVAFPPQNI